MKRFTMDKNKIIEKIIKYRVSDKLEEFRRYILEIEGKFESDKKTLSSYYDDATEGLSDEERMEIDDYFADDYYMIDEIYIGMYRKSTLVSIYSFLENSMNSFCRHLCSRHSYPVKIDDLNGQGIARAKKYLEKLANVDFSILNSEWCHLKKLNKLRNCIVHTEGDIKAFNNTTALKKIIENDPNLSLRNERFIQVERKYIDFIMDRVERFLDKLHSQVFSDN